MKFSDQILQLRNKQKLSQEELSEVSGISVRTIQRIEKDAVSPRPYTARKLLEAFNVSLDEFNTNSDENSNVQSEDPANLNWFIVSNFLIFLLPVVYLGLLIIFWKKRKWSATSEIICRKILSFQIIWTIVSIAVTSFTYFLIGLFGGQYVIGRSFPTPVLVYFGMSLVAVFIVIRIVKSFKSSSSEWTAIIPDLF